MNGVATFTSSLRDVLMDDDWLMQHNPVLNRKRSTLFEARSAIDSVQIVRRGATGIDYSPDSMFEH
jgi:hypothetical protein